MADTVVVLTKRPTEIKEVFDIQLTDSSSPINNRNCSEFREYYQKIWEVFDHEI